MNFKLDLWNGGTGFGFTIWIWQDMGWFKIYLGFEGQIKLFGREIANWDWNLSKDQEDDKE